MSIRVSAGRGRGGGLCTPLLPEGEYFFRVGFVPDVLESGIFFAVWLSFNDSQPLINVHFDIFMAAGSEKKIMALLINLMESRTGLRKAGSGETVEDCHRTCSLVRGRPSVRRCEAAQARLGMAAGGHFSPLPDRKIGKAGVWQCR